MPLPPNNPWPEATQHPYPVADSPRHGLAAAFGAGDGTGFVLEEYAWTYSWTAFVPEGSQIQHIPMLTGSPSGGIPSFETIREMDRRAVHNYWLIFNECEQHWQCDATPQEAAQFYHDVVVTTLYQQGADPDARLVVGGSNAHECGIRWLIDFVTYYEANYGPLPRAGWHFHIYPEVQPTTWPSDCSGQWFFDDRLFHSTDEATARWISQALNTLAFVEEYGSPEDEIWFTEIGCLNYGFHQEQRPICQESGFMASYAPRIVSWLNNEGRWVTRYAWFTNWDDNYWDVTKLLADVGEVWQYSSLGWFYTRIQPANPVGR